MKALLLILTALILSACSQPQTSNRMPQAEAQKNWHGSMQGLAETLSEIMPEVISKPWVNTSRQKKKMQRALKELAKYSDDLDPKKMSIPSNDPSITFLAEDFHGELKRLSKKAKGSTVTAMKPEFRNLTRYCVACHTRVKSESSYFSQNLNDRMSDFDPFEKATYLIAIRQYEQALVQFEKALTNKKWAKKNPDKWSEAAMNMLAISVRVKQNANLTLEMLSRLFDTKSFPKDLYRAARVWQQDAKLWEKETSSKASLKKVKAFLDQAKQREKNLKNSGLLFNLRASAALNEYLRTGNMRAYREQGFLFYSGILGERLKKLNFSAFPKSYYKACKEMNPSSSFGKRCSKRL